MNECPLGAAALAGTSFPIDREQTAQSLEFSNPTANSIDSVSDRDFAIEFLSIASIIIMHLSRFSEEIVVWTSQGFSFIKLSDQFTTGSSIMPQKRNPDAAELVRAKTGRIYGALHTLLTVMKGLPLTYSKDMQEDKEPVFEVVKNLALAINATTGMVRDMEFKEESLLKAASAGFSTATDLADWLVKELGIPFRKCHSITGKVVRLAESQNCQLHELSLEELQKIEPGITEGIFKVLSVENSVKSRNSYGGTAPSNVLATIKSLQKRIAL
jgi:argininosuccinate lyase